MADPFTIATGVVSVISLVVQLAHVVNDFTTHVKDASSGPTRLIDELKALSAVLEQLQQLLESNASSLTFSKTSVLYKANSGCEARLRKLLEKLHKGRKLGIDGKIHGLSGIKQRLTWPLAIRETQEAVQDIHRYAQVFMFALTVEGCELLSKTFSALTDSQPEQLKIANDILHAVRALPDYEDALGKLSRNVNNLEKLSKDQAGRDEERRKTHLRNDILDRISACSPYEKHQDAVSQCQKGTCHWFVGDAKFKLWEKGDRKGILWGFGVPGAGKTILTSFVIEHLRQTLKHRHVAYLYCDYKDENQWPAPDLLASIVRQLAETDERMLAVATELWEEAMKQKGYERYQGNVPSHVLCLEEILQKFGKLSPHIFIVVDGLDEIPERNYCGVEIRKDFANSLQKLPENYHILITSRPHVGIGNLFRNCTGFEISPPSSDIETFVRSSFSTSTRLSQLLGREDDVKKRLVDTIVRQCSGMFLMARLQMIRIASMVSIRQITSTLESIPSRLYAFYGEQMRRIKALPFHEKALCIRVLSWVFRCRKPLSARQLVAGISVERGDTHVDRSGMVDISLILEVCAGLIHLVSPDHHAYNPHLSQSSQERARGEQQVRFVHSTVQDYLDVHEQKLLDTCPGTDIFRACSTYLSLPEILGFTGNTKDLCERYPFIVYAVNFWPAHVSAAMDDEDHAAMERIIEPHVGQAQSLTLSISGSEVEFNPIWLLWTNPDINSTLSLLIDRSSENWKDQLAACPGIITLAELRLPDNDYAFRWFVQNAWEPLILQVAVADDIPGLVESVLDRLAAAGVPLDQYDPTKDFIYPPMLEAINMSKRPIIQKLLDLGHDPNMRWKPGAYHNSQSHLVTPLEAAVQRSWTAVVQMLIEAGADPNLPGGKFGTAMQIAKRNGDVETIQILTEACSNALTEWEVIDTEVAHEDARCGNLYERKLESISWMTGTVGFNMFEPYISVIPLIPHHLNTRRGRQDLLRLGRALWGVGSGRKSC